MKTNQSISEIPCKNRYRSGFLVLAGCVFVTIFIARIHEMGGFFRIQDIFNPPRHIVGYVFCAMPFLVLSLMSIRWGLQNRDFSRDEFICHILGLLPIYLGYLGVARYMAALAATVPGELIGAILYPLSTPLIPFLFKISYWICKKEYLIVFPNAVFLQSGKCINITRSSDEHLKEMFQKSQLRNKRDGGSEDTGGADY